jgi:3-oxoacyl-[acyl-carrier protein] reductase
MDGGVGMDLGLQNQVVFVAGSSRGIGKAIAAALLDEGACVVLTGRDPEALELATADLATKENYERILPIVGDLGDPAKIEAAYERTVTHFGRIDHLIANLGTGKGVPGWEQSEAEWTRLFELNFFASTRLTQAVLPHLLKNEAGGSILYISSIVALEATPAPLPYSAAKAALENYSKNLARQLGAQKVRVNTLAPGNILFEGGSWEKRLHEQREGVEKMLQSEVPQQRFGKPEEIAALAAWLCSPAALFVTGSRFVADGGQTRGI